MLQSFLFLANTRQILGLHLWHSFCLLDLNKDIQPRTWKHVLGSHTSDMSQEINRLKNSKFFITQIGTLFSTYNFALWNKPTYTHKTYMHIYICMYTWTYKPAYRCVDIGTYMHHSYIHTSNTYERICIFTDIVTCPSEPHKTQRRKVPHTTGKYTTQYLLLAQKIKISSIHPSIQMALQPGVGLGLLYNMPPGLSIPCSVSPFVYTHLSQVNISSKVAKTQEH